MDISGCSEWIHFPFYGVFFFSRKLRFFWSPCLLLIAESISLGTSGKPTVVFFLDNYCSLLNNIAQSHLMNLIQLIDCWRADDEFSWNNFYFIVVKEFSLWSFLKNLFRYYFLNIIVNVNFFGDLNITVSTSLKYCYK